MILVVCVFLCTDPLTLKPKPMAHLPVVVTCSLAVPLELHQWWHLHPHARWNRMDRMTKSQLQQEITQLGETPPSAWTKTELKCRLLELREMSGLDKNGHKPAVKTPLQEAVASLNKASKTKAALVKHVQESYMMEVASTWTITQIQKKAVEHIYEHAALSDEDTVNFGRHANLQYQQVKAEYPQYCEWVRTTSQEDKECCVQLRRLATWLDQQRVPPVDVKKPMGPQLREPVPEISTSEKMGHPAPQGRKEKVAPESRAPSSASSNQEMAVMQLVEVVKDLKDELSLLREERPRKKERDMTLAPSSKDSNQSWLAPSMPPKE